MYLALPRAGLFLSLSVMRKDDVVLRFKTTETQMFLCFERQLPIVLVSVCRTHSYRAVRQAVCRE